MSTSNTNPLTCGLRFSAAILDSSTARLDIYEAVCANGNPKRIQNAVYEQLQRTNLDNPKLAFKALFRFLCPKTVPLMIKDRESGEQVEPNVPKHAEKSMDEETGNEVWKWTKWVQGDNAKTRDIRNSLALEIVLPVHHLAAQGEAPAVMKVLKQTVLKILKFVIQPTSSGLNITSKFAIVFQLCPANLNVATEYILAHDTRNTFMWYNDTNSGYMITSSARDASMAAQRVRQRLCTFIQEQTCPEKTQTKHRKSQRRAEYVGASLQNKYRDGISATLAANSRKY